SPEEQPQGSIWPRVSQVYRMVNDSRGGPSGTLAGFEQPRANAQHAAMKSGLVRNRIGENIHVHFLAVLHFVAAATAAAGDLGGVVEAFGAVDADDAAVDDEDFELGGAGAFAEADGGDVEDRAEDGMLHGDGLQLDLRKNALHFATEGLVPF